MLTFCAKLASSVAPAALVLTAAGFAVAQTGPEQQNPTAQELLPPADVLLPSVTVTGTSDDVTIGRDLDGNPNANALAASKCAGDSPGSH